MLACTYAFSTATARDRLEGHLLPLLVHVLGIRRLAKVVFSQGAKQAGKERAHWLAGLISDHDRKLMAGDAGVRQIVWRMRSWAGSRIVAGPAYVLLAC